MQASVSSCAVSKVVGGVAAWGMVLLGTGAWWEAAHAEATEGGAAVPSPRGAF